MGANFPPSPQKGGTAAPHFSTHALLANGWIDQDATWYGGSPWHRPHCVRWGPNSPPSKEAQSPTQFSAHVCCGQMAGLIKIPLGTKVGLTTGDIVLDGDPYPLPPKRKGGAASPTFQPMYCGQMTGWIKMPLRTEVGLGSGYNVLHWDPAPSPKKGTTPHFLAMSIVAKRRDGSRCHLVRR